MTTFVQRPAAIGVTKIRVIVFVKRVSGESFVIGLVLTCVRTESAILNQETVLIVIRDLMDNIAKISAHMVVVTIATTLQDPVHAKKVTFWQIVRKFAQ